MKRMLFNATQAEELRVAIVDGQKLMDLDIETLGQEQRKGNIYKGTITRIEPSLEACFVDYGTDRHGFLSFKEIARSYFQDQEGGRARIKDALKEGMEVLVQVEKDERGNKGAALTTFISLAGRYLVLMPNNPRGGGVSRRIDGNDRQELKAMIHQLDVPNGMSVIARTAGIGRSQEDLQWDLNYLLRLWDAVSEASRVKNVQPLILQESDLVIRAIRDYFQPDIGEILIDTDEVYDKVYQFMSQVMPANLARVKRYEDHTPLFSRFQIEHQIESAYSRDVALPSGGAIVIDHTEALVSIDVNSARATRGADVEETAFKTNQEAAEEIARQLRLRDLGGLVVIDFIDMENQRNQRQVESTLRDALKNDRARVQMGKLSRFGLLELSRQRLQLSLGESTHLSCPRCHGTGFIRGIESTALHAFRIIQEEAMKENTGEVHAQVPVDVATFLLNEKRAELFNLEERLGVPIILIPNIHLENPHYNIERVRLDEVDDGTTPSYKRVEKPEETAFVRSANKTQLKEKNEAAVKGIKPAMRAPENKQKQASLFTRLTRWIKGLFAEDEKRASPGRKKNTSSGTKRKNTGHRRQNRRPNNDMKRRDDRSNMRTNDNGIEEKAARTPTDSRKKRVTRNTDTQSVEKNTAIASNKMSNQASAAPDNGKNNKNAGHGENGRNNRRNRDDRKEDIQKKSEIDINQEPLLINLPDPDTIQAPEKTEKKDRKDRPLRDKKRRSSRKRGIPSSDRLIQSIDIPAKVEYIQKTVRHILDTEKMPKVNREHIDENPLLAPAEEIIPITAKSPVVSETPTNSIDTQSVQAASNIPYSEEKMPLPDLGGLQLIETKPDAILPITPEVPIFSGLRRSDIACNDSTDEEESSLPMQQIETQKF